MIKNAWYDNIIISQTIYKICPTEELFMCGKPIPYISLIEQLVRMYSNPKTATKLQSWEYDNNGIY